METESVSLLRGRAHDLLEEIAELRARIAPLQFELGQVEAAINLMTALPAKGLQASRNAMAHNARAAYPEVQNLTMKQLVLKALSEHFTNGATAHELLDYFALQWGRSDITRTSLSPQLSRLKGEKRVTRMGKVWMLPIDLDFQIDDEDPRDHDLELDALREQEAEAHYENEPHSGEAGGSDADHDDGANVIDGLDQPIPAPGSTS